MQANRVGFLTIGILAWCCSDLLAASPNNRVINPHFLDPALLLALIGAAVTIIGWAITHIYTTIHDAHTRRQAARAQHLKERLEELYGPLVGILGQSAAVFGVATHVLPTIDGKRIAEDKFTDKDIEA